MPEPEATKVKSLSKALRVLECFSTATPELGITEISERLGLYKSNVHNIVDTFAKNGYLERNPDTEKYRLGMKMLTFSHIVTSSLGFKEAAMPHMQQLADESHEMVYLAMPDSLEVIYIHAACPSSKLLLRSIPGVKAPMYCTGIGKAMLAKLPGEDVEAVIAKGLQSFTDHTITEGAALQEELDRIRTRGYAIDNMEHEFGIKCVGMPILGKRGQLVAGISISGPSLRFTDEQILYYAQRLKEVALKIQEKL